jgi:hypothetical protein
MGMLRYGGACAVVWQDADIKLLSLNVTYHTTRSIVTSSIGRMETFSFTRPGNSFFR